MIKFWRNLSLILNIAQPTTKPFSDEVEAPEGSHRYISEALRGDPDSLLYILLKKKAAIMLVRSMVWKMQLAYGLAIAEVHQGKVTGKPF